MSTTGAAFVLVHGGWHNHTVWNKVTPILEAQGFAVLTLDLPAAGAHAIAPKALNARPFDLEAFALEPSPVAGVTQHERTQAVITLVKQAALVGNGKVILVGHSAGGMTISAVAEQVPELLAGIVFIAGFMAPNGMSLLSLLPHESMSSALSLGLFVGDPAVIGATRINPGPSNDAYRALLKASFYADLTDADFILAAAQLHCDEPNGGALTPSGITSANFGSVSRHYIRTTRDCAVPLTGQDYMIESVDASIGGTTITHTLESSHSPFLSQPLALSAILADIAARSSEHQQTKP